ncbi:MAG: Fe-S cluster assembly protein SufD [Pseudolabrys sp.]
MAEVTLIKTPAEQGLSVAYTGARGTLPGSGAVATLREDAFRAFEASGLPHRRVEAWKYTDLRALMREAKPLAAAAELSPHALAGLANVLSGVDVDLIVIVNGRYVGGAKVDADIAVVDLFKFLADTPDYKLGQFGGGDDSALGLNTVFMTGGVAFRVKRGADSRKPIHIAHVFSGNAAASMYPRSVVIVEPGAHVTIVESFSGPDGVDYQVNSALELSIGDNAQVHHIKIGSDGDAALRISTLGVTVGKKAVYKDFAFTIGGAVVRNQTFARFAGECIEAFIGGASLLKNKQHVDNTLLITHAAARCDSRELFKTVLDDQSHGVFQGKIVVDPHAQKTNAKMMTRSLLLSDEAEADQKPELEIFADDVVCGHGATAGALDPGLKFYLMSRGIHEKEAESLLVQAFIGETIEEIAHEGIRDALNFVAHRWLGART